MRSHILLSLLPLAASLDAAADSVAEPLVPRDFDPKGAYTTFTTDELAAAVDNFPVAADKFEKLMAKVFALYNYSVDEHPNYITRQGPKKLSACLSEVCNTLTFLSFFEPTFARQDGFQHMMASPKLMMRIPDQSNFDQFRVDAKSKCNWPKSCQLWIKGTLHFFRAPIRLRFVGETTNDVAYIDAEEIRVYEGNEYNTIRAIKNAAKTSVDLGAVILKYGGVLKK